MSRATPFHLRTTLMFALVVSGVPSRVTPQQRALSVDEVTQILLSGSKMTSTCLSSSPRRTGRARRPR